MPNQEPQSYYGSNESIRIPDAAVSPPELENPVIEIDALTPWEHFPFQIQTDLRLWMTREKKDRLKLAAWWAQTFRDKDKNITPRHRVKVLFHIMAVERLHPSGDRDVATVAYNALWKSEKQGDAS